MAAVELSEHEMQAVLVLEGGELLSHEPVDWAMGRLRAGLARRGVILRDGGDAGSTGHPEIVLHLVAGTAAAAARHVPDGSPEAFAVVPLPEKSTGSIALCARDHRGLVHAILEYADLVTHAPGIRGLPVLDAPIAEAPRIPVRSISRCFSSEIEDKGWLHDKAGWRHYLDMLAEARINRFALTLGMHYNYPYGQEFLNDVYLIFAYPFLLNVPGFEVHAEGLSDAERDYNFGMLKFISRECARRGIDFQLALWFQRYDFDDTPQASYQIRGVDESRHAEYCRDALAIILRECPDISGVTLRVHVECGIPEGSTDFWRTYFSAFDGIGRRIRIDLHAKGIDPELIEIALATGNRVSISPKYTLEQQGLPYHQAAIRDFERPPAHGVDAKWRFSEGSRKFLRYSYGDLLTTDRRYDIMFRIWPGTQRVLVAADAETAAGYGREAGMCGSLGVELCEPLSFKGRMGVGRKDGRILYRDPALQTRYDWEKFRYQYRVWGRRLFSDQGRPEHWQRPLLRAYGDAGARLDEALAGASRFALLLTTSHAPSASNNSWWPEMYENMSIVAEATKLPYGYDMAAPARYGTVRGGDPKFFGSIRDLVADLLSGRGHRSYAPLTVANWFDRIADIATEGLAAARSGIGGDDPEFRRLAGDVAIQAAMSRFFAEKHRAAFAWELHLATGSREAAWAAVDRYSIAVAAWAEAAKVARALYVEDIAFGHFSWLRGRWDDRIPRMEEDVALMRAMAEVVADGPPTAGPGKIAGLLALMDGWDEAQRLAARHEAPAGFPRGADLVLTLTAPDDGAAVFLHHRRVDQSADWQAVEMRPVGTAGPEIVLQGVVPGLALDGRFALQYHFERRGPVCSAFYPALNDTLSNRPYFVVLPEI